MTRWLYDHMESHSEDFTVDGKNEAVLFTFKEQPVKISEARQEKHYLHYKFTALSKANTFPEFSAEAVADGRQIVHYNNKDKSWVRESLTEDDWTKSPAQPPDSRDWFLHQMKTLSNCINTQCSELHILQRIIGCELEEHSDGTVNVTVFDRYGFDGEDFIAFNSDTLKWISKNSKAEDTKIKWDLQTERNHFLMYYLQTCVHWISTFNNTKKSQPIVHVFVGKYEVLTCLVTGFYPRDIEMNIRLNKINTENQTSSGIRPNGDGSFQMRTSVETDRNHKGSYDCHVIHSSLTEPDSVKLDGTCATPSHLHVIVGIVAVFTILIGFCIYKKKTSNCHMNRSDVQTEDSDTGNKKGRNKRKLRKRRFYKL
ncbi:hypothetical protein QQF64_012992 [Cirrhinus molitorella]|uniref:Ig-like domain-containing protein n=1 Tax=Cirrhinus molitorella TaxID=172907 RepID=A0ABR3LPW8_9TELE